jgi:NTE family protein
VVNTRTGLPDRLALVLGGGGLKGFAHIGVLRALEERGIRPDVVAGTSIGSLIAAAYVTGMPIAEMEARACALQQRDLFRIDHVGMVTRRMRNRSLYLEGPLRRLVAQIVPTGTFADLPRRLLISTTDLEHGALRVFGLPGLRDVSVREAVYASCALPGFFPPTRINGHLCTDGAVLDNLPSRIAAPDMDAVIAVDVGSASLAVSRGVDRKGFAMTYQRAAQVMMHTLAQEQLVQWGRPPMLLVRPATWYFPWFTFRRTREMIEAGYAAAIDALDRSGAALHHGRGVYPRRRVELSVDAPACIGCGLCAMMAPQLMRMAADGKATAREGVHEWSRADGGFVHHCPTQAIHVSVLDAEGNRRPSVQVEMLDE